MTGTSDVDPQNFKRVILPELLWKWKNNENLYLFKLFCIDCFRYSMKKFIKSNNGSKLNFEAALNAQ